MIEKTVLDYLTEELAPVSVYMEVPKNPPSKFVKIEKTGSARNDRIDFATLAIQSYAATMYEAAELNEAVKSKMEAIADTENIFSCKLDSDYNYTDTTEKRYRYQAVFDFYF